MNDWIKISNGLPPRGALVHVNWSGSHSNLEVPAYLDYIGTEVVFRSLMHSAFSKNPTHWKHMEASQ